MHHFVQKDHKCKVIIVQTMFQTISDVRVNKVIYAVGLIGFPYVMSSLIIIHSHPHAEFFNHHIVSSCILAITTSY